MTLKIIYYLDVTSSWCQWAEPAWANLKQRYSDRVEFDWQIALLDAKSLPASRTQEEWFYRRSGTITGSARMLRTDSGFWRKEPLTAAVESMLADAAAYASWHAHFGDPPLS